MIKLLQIRNFLLIDSLDVEFGENLCVITGETGAGKSIIVNSLNFLSGDKTTNINIKIGAEFLLISGTFTTNDVINSLLNDYGIYSNYEDLIIKRTMNKNGTTKNFINDVQVTVKILNIFFKEIFDINMQGKKIQNYRKTIDEYGNINLVSLREIYKKLQNNEKCKNELLEEVRMLDIETKYMLNIKNELDELNLKLDEEKDLLEKRSNILSKEKQISCLNEVFDLLSDANEKIYKAQKIFANLHDKKHDIGISVLESCHIEILEILSQTQECLISFEEFSEEDLIAIDQRISKIKDMERKYEKSTPELIAYISYIEKKLQDYKMLLDKIKNIEILNCNLKNEYALEANKVYLARKEIANIIELSISSVLKELELKYCKFCVDFTKEEMISEYGSDKIDFKVSFNPDLEVDSLLDVASGGEKSRFMLALKMIFANNQILVCDEIDTGFSGSTSEAVGNMLLKLASNRQVIVITHQPQVASKGNFHLKIFKEHIIGKTIISIIKLSREERIVEIARMLSGSEITDESIVLSKKLLCIESNTIVS